MALGKTLEPVTLETLPFTGSSDGSILASAAIVALVGAAALVLTTLDRARELAGERPIISSRGWARSSSARRWRFSLHSRRRSWARRIQSRMAGNIPSTGT